jgi:hypothetical protein
MSDCYSYHSLLPFQVLAVTKFTLSKYDSVHLWTWLHVFASMNLGLSCLKAGTRITQSASWKVQSSQTFWFCHILLYVFWSWRWCKHKHTWTCTHWAWQYLLYWTTKFVKIIIVYRPPTTVLEDWGGGRKTLNVHLSELSCDRRWMKFVQNCVQWQTAV